MYYQLPNGKTIWLDVNEILNLTDRDVRELVACNAGEHIINPWHGASIKNVKLCTKLLKLMEKKDVVLFWGYL